MFPSRVQTRSTQFSDGQCRRSVEAQALVGSGSGGFDGGLFEGIVIRRSAREQPEILHSIAKMLTLSSAGLAPVTVLMGSPFL